MIILLYNCSSSLTLNGTSDFAALLKNNLTVYGRRAVLHSLRPCSYNTSFVGERKLGKKSNKINGLRWTPTTPLQHRHTRGEMPRRLLRVKLEFIPQGIDIHYQVLQNTAFPMTGARP